MLLFLSMLTRELRSSIYPGKIVVSLISIRQLDSIFLFFYLIEVSLF